MYSTFPLIWKAFHIKGKIERIMKTIRMQVLPLLPEQLTLQTLNQKLKAWVEEEYQKRKHSSTGQSPLSRYLDHLSLLRPAPKDLLDYFRTPVARKVDKDRTVSLNGKLYEAPAGLIGKNVILLYHPWCPSASKCCSKSTHTGSSRC